MSSKKKTKNSKKTKSSKNKYEQVFIPIGTFDKKKLVASEPYIRKSKDGKRKSVVQDIRYKNEKGVECIPCVEGPKQYCFGVSPVHKYGEDPTPDNIDNYQVCYYITSNDTVEDPTEHEQSFIHVLDSYNNASRKACLRYMKKHPKDYSVLGKTLQTVLKDSEGGWKTPYGGPKVPLNEDGTKKPLRSYFKLIISKKDGKIDKFITSIYDKKSGDLINPLELEDVRGFIHPVFQLGGHNLCVTDKSPFGAFPNIRLWEADYETSTGARRERMLTRASESDSSEEENSDFEEGTNPVDELEKIGNDDSSEVEETKPVEDEKEERRAKRREKRKKKKKKSKESSEDSDSE